MTFNRGFWLRSFREGSFPNWPCPRCYKGILRPLDNGFQYGETGDTQEDLIDSNGTMKLSDYAFHYSVLLRCDNCYEHLASGGSGFTHEYVLQDDNDNVILDDSGNPEMDFVNWFCPEFFYPPIHIFRIPSQCPESVKKEIIASFKLFFMEPPASANSVRKAVEEILTQQNIKRYTITKKRKRVKIRLHERIVEFEKTNPTVAKMLFAVKWIGNEGSHSGELKKNDLLDAYEILEIILDELYVGYRKQVNKKVATINQTKKPLSPST